MSEVLERTNAAIVAAGFTSPKHAFKLQNGYLKLPQPDGKDVARVALSALQAQAHCLRPLLMTDVPACGLRPNKAEFASTTHTVSLVYSSGVPINSYVNGIGAISKEFGDDDIVEFQLACANTFLVAQYLSALRGAAALGGVSDSPRKVYVMPLGGGAFRNPWTIIVRSIALAVELLDDDLRGRLDIKVLAFRDGQAGKSDATPERVRLTELLKQHRKLCGRGFED